MCFDSGQMTDIQLPAAIFYFPEGTEGYKAA